MSTCRVSVPSRSARVVSRVISRIEGLRTLAVGASGALPGPSDSLVHQDATSTKVPENERSRQSFDQAFIGALCIAQRPGSAAPGREI